MNNREEQIKKSLNELLNTYENGEKQGLYPKITENAYCQLIEYFSGLGDMKKALKVIHNAIESFPYDSVFLMKKAEWLFNQEKSFEALKVIERAEAIDPGSLVLKLMKAEILVSVNHSEEAMELLLQIDPLVEGFEKASLEYTKALVYEQKGHYLDMWKALSVSLKHDSDDVKAIIKMILCTEMLDCHDKTYKLATYLTDHNPFSSKSWYLLGHELSSFGRHREAVDAFEYSYLLDKNFEFAYRAGAESFIQLGEFKKALETYQEFLLVGKPDADLLHQIGLCYEGLSNLSIAKTFFTRSIQMDSSYAPSFAKMGACLFLEENYAKAIHFYKKAIELEPKNENYLVALADIYFRLGDDEKANLFFMSSVDCGPENIGIWLRYFNFLLSTGETLAAEQALEEASTFVDGVELLYVESAILYRKNKPLDSASLIKEAFVIAPEMAGLLFVLVPEMENEPFVKRILESI
jgi:tetratricopeptide (TPR) repeat protein